MPFTIASIQDPPMYLPWVLLGGVIVGWIILSFVHRDDDGA